MASSTTATSWHPPSDPPSYRGRFDWLKSLVALLWIEIRRCQGVWLMPLMVGLGVVAAFYREQEPGVVLWLEVSVATLRSYAVIAPLTAALAAWIASRIRRRRTEGLIDSMPIPVWRQDIVTVLTASAIGLAAYGLVFAWFAAKGVVHATWGGPNLGLIAAGALTIPVFSAVGVMIGFLVRNRFAPILALAVTFLLTIGSDAVKQTTTQFDRYGEIASYSSEHPLRLLMPWGLTTAQGASDVYFRVPFVREVLVWMIALTFVALATMAVIRYRNRIAIGGLLASVVVAAVGASPLVQQEPWSMANASGRVAFEWSCRSQSGVEVCLHPAYEARLGDTLDKVATLTSPLVGLPGIPVKWTQGAPVDAEPEVATFGQLGGRGLDWAVLDNIFPQQSAMGPNQFRPVAQIVILTWLTERNDETLGRDWQFGWPVEVPHTAAAVGSNQDVPATVDEIALAAIEPQVRAAVDRFAALEPAAQRTWLESNWAALQAGEITLEQMP